jgi:hypothetical protein
MAELVSIWRAANEMGWPYGRIVQLLILTGQRRNEVTGMRWSELDLAKGQWTIPAERTKPGRVHELPLVPAAVDLIQRLPKIHDQYVFPAKGKDNSASGFSKWKHELDRIAGLSDWRIHDLRRTVASGMAQLKVAPHIIERVLNHTTGTLGGVAGIYNRFGYLDEMREALQRWSDHLINTCSTASSVFSRFVKIGNAPWLLEPKYTHLVDVDAYSTVYFLAFLTREEWEEVASQKRNRPITQREAQKLKEKYEKRDEATAAPASKKTGEAPDGDEGGEDEGGEHAVAANASEGGTKETKPKGQEHQQEQEEDEPPLETVGFANLKLQYPSKWTRDEQRRLKADVDALSKRYPTLLVGYNVRLDPDND